MAIDAASASAAAGLTAGRARVAGAIQQAATVTGTSFEYLVATAKMESNLDPGATAPTSSARGLFQFIDQTWLGTVKEAGAYLGYGRYAAAITRSSAGTYSVSDPAARKAILDLRNDPAANAAMAGVLTHSNRFKLVGRLGRTPTDAELYMAHFMGVNGAGRLIVNAENNPQIPGAQLFPHAAAANRSIFYDRNGHARSVSDVYSVLTARYARAANSDATRTMMASVGNASSSTAPAQVGTAVPVTDNAAYLAAFPDARNVTHMASAQAASAPQASGDVSFRTLFHAGPRSEPVSQAVEKLWVSGNPPRPVPPEQPTSPADRLQQSFDLFSDRNGKFSG